MLEIILVKICSIALFSLSSCQVVLLSVIVTIQFTRSEMVRLLMVFQRLTGFHGTLVCGHMNVRTLIILTSKDVNIGNMFFSSYNLQKSVSFWTVVLNIPSKKNIHLVG